jgi:hypothetical protein
MSPQRREIHFGVFVLGTGNHSAGWRYDGAATSNNDLSVIQEIARHAERGKFDLVFVSDGLVMDPGDHPSFLCRFEPSRAGLRVVSAPRGDRARTPRHVAISSRATGVSCRRGTNAMFAKEAER